MKTFRFLVAEMAHVREPKPTAEGDYGLSTFERSLREPNFLAETWVTPDTNGITRLY